MKIEEESRPQFYKLIRGEEIKKHLRIPPSFIKNLAREISGTATLSSSGSHWHVRVWKNPDGTYLEDGWERFMKDNKLGDDEFLIFSYEGNVRFHVRIFEKNGVKRSRIKPEEIGEVVGSGKRSRGRPRKYPTKNPIGHGGSSGTWKIDHSFTSKFPYFESYMIKSYVERSFLLTIPRSFSNLHFPPTRMKFLLRNSVGEYWEVMCIYHTKRHYISAGWGAFVRDNGLKLCDTCIFELVETNVMQVHVLSLTNK